MIVGVEAVTSGDHGTIGKIPYGEPQGSNSMEQWLLVVKR